MKEDKNKDWVFGRHPVVEAIKSGASVEKLFIQKGMRGEFEKELRKLIKDYSLPTQYVPREKLAKLVKGNHQGVALFLAPIEYQSIEHILPAIYDKGEVPLFVMLDGVTDVRNLGAVARSAECFGAHALIVPGKNSAMINADAIKASAGALLRIPVCRVKSLVNTLTFLQDSGISVMATDLKAAKPIDEVELSEPLAIVLGAEGEGVSQGVLDRANQKLIIPQVGDFNSLNISVAAGVLLYEISNQRRRNN